MLREDESLKVGAVAKAAGVGVQTLHYYERLGLLPKPERSATNYRLYAPETIRRVRFIKKAQMVGLTLEETRQILDLKDHGLTPCAKVAELGEKTFCRNRCASGAAARVSPRTWQSTGRVAEREHARAEMRRRILRFDRAAAVAGNFFQKSVDPLFS